MSKPRILITRRWPEQAEQAMAEHFELSLNEDDKPMSEAALIDAMGEYDAICPCVTDCMTAAILQAEQARVKIIGNYGVGFDHIDIQAAKAAGLAVTNTPGVLTDATADLAMTLMLMLARRGGEGERMVRAGEWDGWYPTQMMGGMISGKALGIVGMGRIGVAMAERACHGFGMKILYHNRRQVPGVESLNAEYFENLEDLLPRADFVAMHCPSSPETFHLMNKERFALMKPSACLINTARGDVVDESALIRALQEGQIAGAGLDVYEQEPRVPEALLSMENVVLLPHLGSATVETRTAMGLKVLENLRAWFDGGAPPDRIV